VVVGTKKMVIYDDTSSDAKIKLFEKGFDKILSTDKVSGYTSYGEFQLQLRDGDCIIPKLNFKEPLKEECDHFIDCIINNKTPLTDGKNGSMVVKILELAQESIKKAGITIKCDK
jgi:predicted dehydrogenase